MNILTFMLIHCVVYVNLQAVWTVLWIVDYVYNTEVLYTNHCKLDCYVI